MVVELCSVELITPSTATVLMVTELLVTTPMPVAMLRRLLLPTPEYTPGFREPASIKLLNVTALMVATPFEPDPIVVPVAKLFMVVLVSDP